MTKKSTNQAGFAHVVLVLLILVGVIAAIGIYVQKRSTINNAVANGVETAALKLPFPGKLEPTAQVAQLAETQQSANVSTIALEKVNNMLVYKIGMTNGKVVSVNAQTGDTIKTDSSGASTSGIVISQTALSKTVGFSQALQTAQSQKPSNDVSKIQLQPVNGTLIYKAMFKDGSVVNINADTGTVIQNSQTIQSTGSNNGTNNYYHTSTSTNQSTSTSNSTTQTVNGTSGTSNNSSNSSTSSSGANGSSSSQTVNN